MKKLTHILVFSLILQATACSSGPREDAKQLAKKTKIILKLQYNENGEKVELSQKEKEKLDNLKQEYNSLLRKYTDKYSHHPKKLKVFKKTLRSFEEEMLDEYKN